MECIVTPPRAFNYRKPEFWDAYRDVPAWNFQRFAEIAERGKPIDFQRTERAQAAQKERDDLEASLRHTRQIFGL